MPQANTTDEDGDEPIDFAINRNDPIGADNGAFTIALNDAVMLETCYDTSVARFGDLVQTTGLKKGKRGITSTRPRATTLAL